MSGWQAPRGSARSPLDRQPPSISLPGQPPSFKSNVNRAKTMKWVEAKSYSYDGDDWGEYDEYDEYGADNEPPPLPEPTSSRQPGQTVGSTVPGRSFTNPISASNIPPRRTNSFDAGDERRAFSSELPSSPLSRTRPPSLNTGNIATSPEGVTPIAKMPQYQQLYGQTLTLQAAGSAMADALMASMGMGKDEEPSESVDTDFQAPTRNADAPSKQPGTWKQSVGDIYLRPLAVQRSMTASSAASSIPPTPPPKDVRSAESPSQTSNYFASSSPPKESRLAPPMQTKDLDEAQRPALLSQSSTDSSLPEAESDRLTNEIVRSLTPQPNAQSAEAGNAAPPIQSSWSAVPVPQHNRESTIAPREHDSYRPGDGPLNEDTVRVSENPWVDEDCNEPSPSVAQPPADSAVKEEIHQPLPVAPDDPHRATKNTFDAQPALLNKRFSWEKNPASDLVSNATVAELASRDNMPYKERSAGLHVVNAELELEPETPDIESAHGDPSAVIDNRPAAQEQTLNSEPQILGTPASASAGAATEGQTLAAALPLIPGRASTESPHTLHATERSSPCLSSPKQSLDSPLSPVPFRELSSTLQTSASPVLPSTVAPQSPISPSTRIPPFREILALKSTNERIQTYNKTREQFADMNTGLSEWVAATLAAHPEHAEVLSQAQRPSVSVPGKIGSIKHRHSPSIMRFTKQGGSTQQGTPYYQQYLDSASAVPDAMSSSAAGMGQLAPGSPVGASNQGGLAGPSAGVGDRRITGQQMQAKGKDLLASAGKMGGKGMVGAKGLFAKGKKRFGSGVGGGDDKVDN
ncbi:hypothetical protein B0A49_04192 [Cryomyces minteri]|uniref:Uncharacterized protein n=1 Tax=Cryomyces minteri TaxID=331657 RepID=A0A4U0XDH3_9PEZI|nr:hypothetical protein B0A49_05767 [Cryomyces minteri]TKA73558.1 hypothetical protein B0A49_04192 [Cryomyces minteri]